MPALIIASANRHKIQEIQKIISNNPDLASRYKILSLKDLPNPPELVENGKTFFENAGGKASQLARFVINHILSGEKEERVSALKFDFPLYIIADDSGLEVDYLNGEPGVNSARFSNPTGSKNTPDKENNLKLLRLLNTGLSVSANRQETGNPLPLDKRTARFRCVLAVIEIPACLLTDLKYNLNKNPVLAADTLFHQIHYFEGVCEGKIGYEEKGENGFGYDPLFIPDGYTHTFAELGEEIKNKISHRAKALHKFIVWLESRKSTE